MQLGKGGCREQGTGEGEHGSCTSSEDIILERDTWLLTQTSSVQYNTQMPKNGHGYGKGGMSSLRKSDAKRGLAKHKLN